MTVLFGKGLVFILCFQLWAGAQTTPPLSPNPSTPPIEMPSQPQAPTEPLPTPQGSDDSSDSMVIKKNNFIYDSTEGRDPFKIFREIPFPMGGEPGPKAGQNQPPQTTDGILTAIVPNDLTLVGILFKKTDPIVLVKVRNVKGLFKLKLNSRVGRSEGKVIDIQKDRVIIEQVRDFDGQKYSEKIVMKIRDKKR